jgi:hypothetical protein
MQRLLELHGAAITMFDPQNTVTATTSVPETRSSPNPGNSGSTVVQNPGPGNVRTNEEQATNVVKSTVTMNPLPGSILGISGAVAEGVVAPKLQRRMPTKSESSDDNGQKENGGDDKLQVVNEAGLSADGEEEERDALMRTLLAGVGTSVVKARCVGL